MNDDLSDCDIEIDDKIRLPIVTCRNASTEPTIPTDLTPYQARILETEDEQNDLVLRDFVPSDCFDLIRQETDRFLQDKERLLLGMEDRLLLLQTRHVSSTFFIR
ncbi:unnamed protein product [Pieris brassicae]|uniref:Uncharacterized protein n=1 Tax=Pieris brassicae TaxID=7116 RepID=A0A9P0TR58_PIEBR|nr:unnamed protein product [Pieris brassicae]